MSDDLFSKAFQFFDSPGPVNLKLAAEVAHHLVGEAEPVDPWAAEEFRELTRLAEYRIEQVAPFPVIPAPDVVPLDVRGWVDTNLSAMTYLAEPFGKIIDLGDAAPESRLLTGLAPAMIGIQLGTLVGSLGRWVMAGFDAGIPVQGEKPITLVVPNIEAFTDRHSLDPQEVRLWIALNEAAHRAIFQLPHVMEHLIGLLDAYAGAIAVGPEKIITLFASLDPAALTEAEGIDRIGRLFDTPQARIAHRELSSFLGLTGGYRRLLVYRGASDVLPGAADIDRRRDSERDLGEAASSSALTATFVESSDLADGLEFCRQVEARLGPQALAELWQEGNLPIADELGDPTGWAARVLLDGIG